MAEIRFPFSEEFYKVIKKAVVTFTLVWILVAGEIVNAASGSGGRIGGSFKSSSVSASSYRPSTGFPTRTHCFSYVSLYLERRQRVLEKRESV